MKTDIISRMEANQALFGRKDNRTDEQKAIGAYYDREMANRSDNGTLDYLSEEQEEEAAQ